MAEKRTRFHLDESVTVTLAKALRKRCIDVTTPAEVELIGASDEAHLAFAQSHHRVIVTHDRDFLRLHHQGARHSGVAYCHQEKHPVGELLRRLLHIHHTRSSAEMVGRVAFL